MKRSHESWEEGTLEGGEKSVGVGGDLALQGPVRAVGGTWL